MIHRFVPFHFSSLSVGLKSACLLIGFTVLTACSSGRDLDRPAVPLGDFRLGHSVVIAPNLTKGPLSRDATQEEWIAAVDKAIEDRFRRYEGERLYHFGVSIEGYVLAQVGVPLVLQPNSVVILRLTVWDDAASAKMNEEPKEITVLEAISPETVAGSGLTQTREEQMENLAVVAAKQIEEYLVEQRREARWFRGYRPAGAVDAPVSDGADGASNADALDQAALEEVVDAANSGPSEDGGQLVEEPLEAVTDPVVRPIPRPQVQGAP